MRWRQEDPGPPWLPVRLMWEPPDDPGDPIKNCRVMDKGMEHQLLASTYVHTHGHVYMHTERERVKLLPSCTL